MDILELKTEPRNFEVGHAKNLRRLGYVPVVLYGRERETESLQVNARDLHKVMSVAGTHQLVSLEVNKDKVITLAREIQLDYIKHEFIHVDFQEVRMDEKIHTQIPLVFEGEAPGIEIGGVLTQGLDVLDVECLPTDLVESIKVDVSGLAEFNDTISVGDLTLPAGLTVMSEPESMVAKIEAPRKVEELEALDEEEVVTGVEPEVISEAEEEVEEE